MKSIIKIMMIATAILSFTCTATAQHRRGGERMSQEQLAEKQAKHIAQELSLSPETSELFISTYINCQKEIWSLGPRHTDSRQSHISESQADSAIQDRFERSQRVLDIRKKYYAEYCKFLTPKQIERVYELERQMMRHLYHRRNSRRR